VKGVAKSNGGRSNSEGDVRTVLKFFQELADKYSGFEYVRIDYGSNKNISIPIVPVLCACLVVRKEEKLHRFCIIFMQYITLMFDVIFANYYLLNFMRRIFYQSVFDTVNQHCNTTTTAI
jgi:hypothetical protein